MTVTPTDGIMGFEIDVKRFNVPYRVESRCPRCQQVCTQDLSGRHHLSNPKLNTPSQFWFYCGGNNGCQYEWSEGYILTMTLTPCTTPGEPACTSD